jgi:hypothetical protein
MSRAIMQQAFDAFEDLKKSVTRDGTVSENWDAYYEKEYYALEALRQALAQPEQEPVAWLLPEYGDVLSASEADGTGIYNVPLYTAPPRKEWVGLTDEEIKEVLDLNVAPWSLSGVALQHVMDDARALEAKLKEKNT